MANGPRHGEGRRRWARLPFGALVLFSLTPWSSPPLSLVLGLAFGLVVGNPLLRQTRLATKYSLQASIVLLGFGMDLREVIDAGRSGAAYTVAGIVFALGLGLLLGRMVGVCRKTSYLIAAGTAICGGSAIAAVGPVIEADADQLSVSLATVFLLNAAALFVFPPLGAAAGLTEPQFGLWSALAIHDTSSVVGAAAKYGPGAVVVATTVKLARALWIVPLAVVTAVARGRRVRIVWPWFILFFLGAALVRSAGEAQAASDALYRLGRAGLGGTLFLIGSGMSRETLRSVGVAPLIQGTLLWVAVAAFSLYLVTAGLFG